MTTGVSKKDIETIRSSGLFDEKWYLEQYPVVKVLGMDPVEHYLQFGVRLKNHPSGTLALTSAQLNELLLRLGQAQVGVSSTYQTHSLKNGKKIERRLASWNTGRESLFRTYVDKLTKTDGSVFNRISASIVMPTFNRADSLHRSIDSVIRQDFPNWELLVVDDGSVDKTVEVVSKYSYEKRVKYFPLSHVGVSGARNTGLDAASGDYIFFLDSDNTWETDYLRSMVVYLSASGLDAAYCGLKALDDQQQLRMYRGDDFDWVECYKQNYVDINCFGHRNVDTKGIRFDVSLPRLVDWDYILRFTADRRTSFAPFCGVNYYDGTGGRRITLTEALGAELDKLMARIRNKHNESSFSHRTSRELRPSLEDILLEQPRAVLNDEHSRPIAELEQKTVDWMSATSRQLKRDLVSIVILCFNNSILTHNCIRSILDKSNSRRYEIEIVAVNNGSTDDTKTVLNNLSRQDARVIAIDTPQNLTFSSGNNFGVSFLNGEYCIFLNNDTFVVDGWLDPLIDALRLDESIGAVGPKLLYAGGTLQCGGLVFSNKSKIPYHLYRHFLDTSEEVNKARTFQAVTGACIAFRTGEFVDLRGFDPIFINGCEDLDICFRVTKKLRKRVLYNPRSTIVHLESASEGRGRLISRNRGKFVRRWGTYVKPDDTRYYAEDGFEVQNYDKPGREPDGDTASYVPKLVASQGRRINPTVQQARSTRLRNIGFSTMWYARGIAFHTKQIADALEGDGIRTHVFARWESHRFVNAYPIYHPRVTNAGDDPSVDDIVRWVKDNEIELLIFMEVHPNDWKRVAAVKKLGVRIVCYENIDIMRHENVSRYDVFDTFLFNSFYSRDLILSYFPEKKLLMIPWGAESPRTVKASERPPVDRRHKIEFVHIAGWGGLNSRKNTGLLIKAFSFLDAHSCRLHLYTQAPLVEYGADVLRICSSSQNICVKEGTIDDIGEAYEGKDILVWPSKREGVGLPILEALVRGLPVLISNGYMMKQWVIPGEHGVVCSGKSIPGRMVLPELDVDEVSLREAMADLVARPEMVQQLKQRVSEDRVVWEWDWQKDVIRAEIKKMMDCNEYTPAEDLSYLPPHVLEFEFRRRLAYAEGR